MHRWTDEERDIVRQRYDGTRASAEAIARELGGLTFLQVRGQVQKLKLGHPSEKWSPEDLAFLRKNYGLVPDEVIEKKLKRTHNSIILTVKRRLQINRKSNFYTARELAKILGISCSKTITETWMPRKWIRGIKSPVRCGPNIMWSFKEEEITRCLRARPYLVEISDIQEEHLFRSVVQEEWDRDPWYGLEEAGYLLDVGDNAVVKYIRRGDLPATKKTGGPWQGVWIVRRSAIEEFLKNDRRFKVHMQKLEMSRKVLRFERGEAWMLGKLWLILCPGCRRHVEVLAPKQLDYKEIVPKFVEAFVKGGCHHDERASLIDWKSGEPNGKAKLLTKLIDEHPTWSASQIVKEAERIGGQI
jgi:hypothetical protein